MEQKINIDSETLSLKSIIVKYLHHWKLFIGAFCFSLIPAILYLIYYPKTYEMVSVFNIQSDNGAPSGSVALGDAAGLMKSFGLNDASGTGVVIDDEKAVLVSHDLWTKVVKRLGLNAKYVKPFSWNYEDYENRSFTMSADSSTLLSQKETIEFFVEENGSGQINVIGKTKSKEQTYAISSLPATITFGQNTFILTHTPTYEAGTPVKTYITMRPAGFVADDLVEAMSIETFSDNSNVIECVFRDYEKQRGLDVLNTLVEEYNLRAESIKNKDAFKTVQFLDSRINEITAELINVEQLIESYKIKNHMTDIEYDVQFYVDQMKDIQSKIVELESQGHAIKFMEQFVQDPANKYSLVPVLMNVQDGEKGGSALSVYNEALVERYRMLQNLKADNPLLTTMDKQLDQMRNSVFLTIKNAQESLNLTLRDVKLKEKTIYAKMGNMPTQEREYLNYKRQQEIIQGVYLILLQKREEAMLKMGRDVDRALIIDYAYAKSLPVAPRKLYAAIAILLLTLIIPVVYLFCKEQFLSLKDEYQKTKMS